MAQWDVSPTYSGALTSAKCAGWYSGFNQGDLSANLAGYWSGVQPPGSAETLLSLM